MNDMHNEFERAVRTSRALDDGVSEIDATPDAVRLRRVHEALSDRAAMPGAPADPIASERVIALLGGERRSLALRPAWRRWAIAASVVLAAGTGVTIWRAAGGPGAPTATGPATAERTSNGRTGLVEASGLDLAVLFGAPASSDAMLSAAIDRPLQDEADRLRADAARAADVVLARLPVRWE